MKVAILGCGPAGLLAAHAVRAFSGAQLAIFSKKRKSEMFGAQFLHESIPMIPLGEPSKIEYKLLGTEFAYCAKVYGPETCMDPSFKTSVEELQGDHLAWDIRRGYDWLWRQFEASISNVEIDARTWAAYGRDALADEFDLIVNTIPKYLLCSKPAEHKFNSQEVWAIGDAPERGRFVAQPYPEDPDNTVTCNGYPEASWYRYSRIFGYRTMEWSRTQRRKPPIEGIGELQKPISNDCDCNSQVLHVGRYGKWEKGVLVHSAFTETLEKVLS